MRVQKASETESQPVDMEGASGCRVRWLIGDQDRAPNFAMRQFEIAPGGHTPHHFHPYEHEIYVTGGEGVVVDGEQLRQIRAGDVIYVAPDDVHQFRNTGSTPLEFLCLIPNSAADKSVTVVAECNAVKTTG